MSADAPEAHPRMARVGIHESPGFLRALLLAVGVLLLTRLGLWVPLPYLDHDALTMLTEPWRGGMLDLTIRPDPNGRANASVFALGLWPFVYAWALCEFLRGHTTAQVVARWRRWLTALIAIGMALHLATRIHETPQLVADPSLASWVAIAMTLVAGTMLLVWLGEQITKTGLCDGVWLIIAANVMAGLPGAVLRVWNYVQWGVFGPSTAVLIAALLLAATALIVMVERARRHIEPSMASGAQRRETEARTMPVDMATILPAIAASVILTAIPTGLAWLYPWLGDAAYLGLVYLGPGQPLYVVSYAVLIVVATFVATARVAPHRMSAAGMGADGHAATSAPGIPPERNAGPHANLDRSLDRPPARLTVITAVYLLVIFMMPELLMMFADIPLQVGGMPLMIVVLVMLDILSRARAQGAGPAV